MTTSPKLTVTMCVYNEEKYLENAILSIVNQTYSNFTFLILNNGSTDSSREIIERCTQNDPRVNVITLKENVIPRYDTIEKIFGPITTPYILPVCGHDLWHPRFIEKCIVPLETDSRVVLAYSQTLFMKGESGEEQFFGPIAAVFDTMNMSAMKRVMFVASGLVEAYQQFGIFRTDARNKVRNTNVMCFDHVMLAELASIGMFAMIDEPLFYLRQATDWGDASVFRKKHFPDESDGVKPFFEMTQAFMGIADRCADPYEAPLLRMALLSNCCLNYLWTLHIFRESRDSLLTLPFFNKLYQDIIRVGNDFKTDLISYFSQRDLAIRADTIIIDGVFFQFRMTGIARVWFHLLEVWGQTEFGQRILVLDRAGTAPKIKGIRYREIPALNMTRLDLDRALLQAVCDEENAALFCSSYYTVPVTTPSVFMAYDMIPENTEFYDLENSMWQMKHHGIRHASAYLAISRSAALDLARFYPKARDKVTVAYCAVDRGRFYPATPSEVDNFKGHFNIHAPYVLFVGDRTEHKNGVLLFRTLAGMFPKGGLEVVCVGGAKTLEPAFEDLAKGFAVHVVQLGDRDLRAAYTGATALIYPSAYEGFGLPILEAMACDCPVITCSNSSIPEVAGGAAIYVSESNADEMAAAICNVMRPDVRQGLIQLGRSQVMRFSWERMADTVKHVLQQVPLL